MKKDIERGNIAGNAAKRQYAEQYARSMIQPLADARSDLKRFGDDKNYSAIARWLTHRGFKTINGRTFRQPTVDRLLNHTERTIGRAAIDECDTEIAIITYEFQQMSPAEQAERVDADNEMIRRFRDVCLARHCEAKRLGKELRGESAVGDDLINEEAVTLENDLRTEAKKKPEKPVELYARRVLSKTHQRRDRPAIEVRKARKKARVADTDDDQPTLF